MLRFESETFTFEIKGNGIKMQCGGRRVCRDHRQETFEIKRTLGLEVEDACGEISGKVKAPVQFLAKSWCYVWCSLIDESSRYSHSLVACLEKQSRAHQQ